MQDTVGSASLSGWMNAFLGRRNLRQPDQRPLYQYQLSAEEYEVLLNRLQPASKVTNFHRNRFVCAAFCLFCSEWYRREYKLEYGWSWEFVWQRLGFQLTPQELSYVVPTGLEQFWNRPVRFYESGHRNFLGSLFSEGGLPFRMLQKDNSRFQNLFTGVLKQHAASMALEGSIKPLVVHLIEKVNLPQVFREDTSVELITGMADRLVQLVETYQLQNASNPVEVLEERYVRWRESFPIPLDSETGSQFLNVLLTSASKESRQSRARRSELSCEHMLNESSGQVRTRISLPATLSVECSAQPSSNRFELSIYEGEKMLLSLGPAYGEVQGRQVLLKMRLPEVICPRHNPESALRLVASIGGHAMYKIEVPNSLLALSDVPIGFVVSEDGSWQQVGQGSFCCKKDQLRLLVPAETEVTSEHCLITALNSPLPEQSAWQLSGEGSVFCQQGEDRFKIQLGSQLHPNAVARLSGNQLPWSTVPSETFLGTPKIESAELGCQVFLNGKTEHSCALNERLGLQRISVKTASGDTLLRRRVGVLPADFKLELKAGDIPGQGTVIFSTSINCFYQLLTEGVSWKRVKNGAHHEYALVSEQPMPPTRISFSIQPNLESDPIKVEVPFPVAGVLAVDRNENPLGNRLSLDDLLGARFYLYASQDRPVEYRIDLRLHGRAGQRAHYDWCYTTMPDCPVEISLYELRNAVQSLLSLEGDIDQQVILTIQAPERELTYRIQRYPVSLEYRQESNLLSAQAILGRDVVPKLQLVLLSEPERHPINMRSRVSEGIPTGEFEIPAEVERFGPWLVVPAKDSPVSFRPVFLAGNYQRPEPFQEIRTLQKAVLAFDHMSSSNAFTPVLDKMAKDPDHTGWQFLKAQFDQYEYLSLAIFEVWKALVDHPAALAMAMHKFSSFPNFLGRFEEDFPFVWEAQPIEAFRAAASAYWKSYEQMGLPEEVISHLQSQHYQNIRSIFHSFEPMLEKWVVSGDIPAEVQVPDIVMKEVLFSWYQELIQNHSSDEWPAEFSKRLKGWHQELASPVLAFEPELGFRNSVVYLPVYLAAVAAGETPLDRLFPKPVEATFYLRQIRDFDSQWFDSLYRYSLLKFIAAKTKEPSYS